MLTVHKLQLKRWQMPAPQHKHTLRNANTSHENTAQTHEHIEHDSEILAVGVASNHMNKKVDVNTHTHTLTLIHMPLSECCLLTRSSITKRFSLPHTCSGEGRVCVRALVPLKLLFVCVHTFFIHGCVSVRCVGTD